ncbi:helix-turn-helix domain-containing protein [Spirosoma sp. HMF3257]|uniref:AraC family transcriptional regulator n=2 Tax=Spirosoma telluris TaxID=2183553 RepID=A0A327NPM0_9BACT|nr:helix-turn-helix domain-containing protein [Spirosoma telluris]RAI77182.1 AraC family transcriptional regulator [Spirosoma telluris]
MAEIFDNIRKLYRFARPCPELADYIEFFSESSAEETYQYAGNNRFTVRMFPSWTPTCYINLGQPYQLVVGSAQYQIQQHTDVLILRNNIVERHNLPTDHIFTIKFFPGGLEAILGINQAQFSDQVVKLEVILPATLLHRIKQLTEFEERVELLQHFFLSQYKKKSPNSYYVSVVQKAIDIYGAGNMELTSGQLAGELFITNKTIYRYFTRVIGTTPKQYFATVRARAALAAYVANKNLFSPYEHGYYDMSHFYKDVIRFTGRKLIENAS